MREIDAKIITDTVESLCIDAACGLGQDVEQLIRDAAKKESLPRAQYILNQLIDNIKLAREQQMPICQDTGMAVVFVEMGQDVHITGSYIIDAINEGVRRGYRKGYLRKSVVKDPLERVNTGDNTPAIIHVEIVPGSSLSITVAPKGFGSENMSALKMLKPADGIDGIKAFVLDTVKAAGGNPCPPVILGIGIGGTMEKAAYIAKKALLRDAGQPNSNESVASLEQELLHTINALGIGPQGLGGAVTALAVHIETFATHIAGLPVAINMQCHASRHKTAVL
ncbi:fumarate hydratase [Mahella australiensis]|uniref:Fumarase alpha subunit n=1 Tax=Mahella australiensis (strain DSM 15567 / CIP 107919 / 50-1 BON) TaxID=697281 RepID=F4A188_MAHA5|nr:fumarate hydratase [Mahella australiensis]AEE97007.1 fumarase alpha subunit [Mahella australiensis 50-1 BON]